MVGKQIGPMSQSHAGLRVKCGQVLVVLVAVVVLVASAFLSRRIAVLPSLGLSDMA